MEGRLAAGLIAAESVVVISPHCDDEVVGCGGTVLRYLECGARVDVAYLTDGPCSREKGDRILRSEEAVAVWESRGGVRLRFLHVPDKSLCSNKLDAAEFVEQTLRECHAEIVLVPWCFDAHPDHYYSAWITAMVANRVETVELVGSYEVQYPVLSNHTIDISRWFEAKMDLLSRYKSQDSRRLRKTVESLNRFRACSLGLASYTFAEGFFFARPVEFWRVVESSPLLLGVRHDGD
jgi:LmbE family N-acetylglucosaminyl deacetylase